MCILQHIVSVLKVSSIQRSLLSFMYSSINRPHTDCLIRAEMFLVALALLFVLEWLFSNLVLMLMPHNAYHCDFWVCDIEPSEMLDIRQQIARIEAAALNTFHHMYAPNHQRYVKAQ